MEDKIPLLDGKYFIEKEFILKNTYCNSGDILLVGGSLVEGLGNEFSDVDVYVITEKLRMPSELDLKQHHRVIDTTHGIIREQNHKEAVRLIHTVIPDTGMKIDVEYRTFDELFSITDKLVSIYEYAVNNLVLLSKFMVYREIMILHRFYNSIVLFGKERYQQITEDIQIEKFHYVNHRWVTSDFSVLLDIIGAWKKGEIERSVDLSRENLALQMQGLLAINGLTNTRKWILSMVDRLPSELKEVVDDFKRLYMMIDVVDSVASQRKYVQATLDLVDQIYAKSHDILENSQFFPSGTSALEMLRAKKTNMDSKYADLEMAYRSKIFGKLGLPSREYLELEVH